MKRIIAPPLTAAFRNEAPATGIRLIIREVLNQHVDMDAMTMHPLLFMPYYMIWIKGLDLELLIDHTVRYTASVIREMATWDSNG